MPATGVPPSGLPHTAQGRGRQHRRQRLQEAAPASSKQRLSDAAVARPVDDLLWPTSVAAARGELDRRARGEAAVRTCRQGSGQPSMPQQLKAVCTPSGGPAGRRRRRSGRSFLTSTADLLRTAFGDACRKHRGWHPQFRLRAGAGCRLKAAASSNRSRHSEPRELPWTYLGLNRQSPLCWWWTTRRTTCP